MESIKQIFSNWPEYTAAVMVIAFVFLMVAGMAHDWYKTWRDN